MAWCATARGAAAPAVPSALLESPVNTPLDELDALGDQLGEARCSVRLLGGCSKGWRTSGRGFGQSRRVMVSGTEHFRDGVLHFVVHCAMADTITFRPDEDASRALEILTRDGTPVSTAVRTALIEAARRQASARLRAEAAALASDQDDRAEAAQVLRDMETLRAW